MRLIGKRNVARVSKIEMGLGRRRGLIHRWPTPEDDQLEVFACLAE
jgi:hypothetical protein